MSTTNTRRSARRAAQEAAADRQGFVTDTTLRSVGIGPGATNWQIECGNWHRILPGVIHLYLDRSRLTREQWILARQLAAGVDARTGGLAALEAYDMSRFRAGDMLELVVPRQRRIILPDTHIRRAVAIGSDPSTHIRGLKLPSIEWLIADLGRFLTPFQVANVIHQACYHQRRLDFDIDRLRELVAEQRRVGRAVVRHALSLHDCNSAGTRSFTEDDYVRIVQQTLGRDPIVNTVAEIDGRTYEVDIGLLPDRVRIEIDGGQHGRVHDSAVDRVRSRIYADDRFVVLRETSHDIRHRPQSCARRLIEAVAEARRRFR